MKLRRRTTGRFPEGQGGGCTERLRRPRGAHVQLRAPSGREDGHGRHGWRGSRTPHADSFLTRMASANTTSSVTCLDQKVNGFSVRHSQQSEQAPNTPDTQANTREAHTADGTAAGAPGSAGRTAPRPALPAAPWACGGATPKDILADAPISNYVG